MRRLNSRWSGVVLAGLVSVFSAGPIARPADPVLTSGWRAAEIVVDGSTRDWAKLESLDKGPAVAFQNDGDALYLTVATSNPDIRRQMSTGLVLWFDSSSKKAQTAGVRLNGAVRGPFPGARPEGVASVAPPGGPSAEPFDQFDWLGPGKNERKLVDVNPTLGLAMAIGTDEGVLAYEVKLPLQKTERHPYAVNAAPGATMLVGIETPTEPPMREGRGGERGGGPKPGGGPPMGGGMGSGGMRGGGGLPPSGGGPAGDMPRIETQKPLRLLWINVKLATKG